MPQVRYTPGKFSTRASSAQQDYATGVQSPRRSQSESAIAAKDNWKASLDAAAAAGLFEKGLRASGDGEWKKGVETKGKARYSSGVLASEQKYVAKTAKFRSALEGLTLQPRGPKGTNYGRVQQVGDLMKSTKNSG